MYALTPSSADQSRTLFPSLIHVSPRGQESENFFRPLKLVASIVRTTFGAGPVPALPFTSLLFGQACELREWGPLDWRGCMASLQCISPRG